MNVINVEIYSLLVLLIITIDYYLKYKNQKDTNSYFFYILVTTIALTSIINIILNVFESVPTLNYFLLFIRYVFIIIPSLVLYGYTRKNYFFSSYKPKKVYIIFAIYYLIYFLMILYVFTHNFISVLPTYMTEMEQYNILLLFALLPLIILLAGYFYKLIIKKKSTVKVLIFILVPILGIFFDLVMNTFTFVSTGYTLGALMLYIIKYDRAINIDSLTQTYNRRFFDVMMTESNNLNQIYAILVMDVDDFKKINDTYGHLVGDEALRKVSELLNTAVRSSDYVIRYGGDEFVVVGKIKDNKDLNLLERKIQTALKKYNNTADIKISLSIGKGIFDSRIETLKDFFDKIDKEMYKQKKENK